MSRILAFALAIVGVALLPLPAVADAAFDRWLQAQWPEAQKLGVSRKTFEEATRGLEPDLSLPDLDLPQKPDRAPPAQPEFVQTPADYLKESSLQRLAAHGRKLAQEHRATLAAIERQFGVPGPVVLAIFGRETDYGRYKLPHSAIRVLATQGYLGRRKDQFRQEFLQALKMLEEGQVMLATMRSSWAGAMGLVQFLPSDFYRFAADGDGDGRRDIWTSVPDALASAAAQLVGKGWQSGRRWAYEVTVPGTIDCTVAEPGVVLTIDEWVARGVRPVSGRNFTQQELREPASLLMPEGILRSRFPDTEKLLRAEGIQRLRSLRAVCRKPERPDRGRRAIRHGMVEGQSAQDPRRRGDAARAGAARRLCREDRRQGGDENARGARCLSEGERPEGRLLADLRRARSHAGIAPLTVAETEKPGGGDRGRASNSELDVRYQQGTCTSRITQACRRFDQ